MDMTGEYRIPAPRSKVWEALNNPDVLRAAIPGCESLEKLSETEMTGRISAKVGPVSAKFSGKVTLSDLDPPNGYRISGEGSGGAAGFAKGGATVTLADDGAGGTVLNYKVDAQIGGKLAQIGSRLIDGVARKMAEDFFGRFSAAFASSSAASATPAAAAPPAAAQTPPPVTSAPGMRLPPWAWIAGLVVVVIVILAIFAL